MFVNAADEQDSHYGYLFIVVISLSAQRYKSLNPGLKSKRRAGINGFE
jgi:hypothetical protein